MRQFTLMDRLGRSILTRLGLILSLALVVLLTGCEQEEVAPTDAFSTVPYFVAEHHIVVDGDTLIPVRLQMYYDTLAVSYNGLPRIDLFDTTMNRADSILLTETDDVIPTSFHMDDSLLVVTDHPKRVMVLYDRQGKILEVFGRLPDNTTNLAPFAVTFLGGVAYMSDFSRGTVLAISLVTTDVLTERGELILTIPSDSVHRIGMPSMVYVTWDGRLLVGDALDGEINVFTCDGRYIYDFDSLSLEKPMGPMGVAVDQVADPSMQDTTTFDPSGIRLHGRTHVVDAHNGKIHMFNTLGKYIASYPEDSVLVSPSGIAIDRADKSVYVADPARKSIMEFRYDLK